MTLTKKQRAIIHFALRYTAANIDHALDFAKDDPEIGEMTEEEFATEVGSNIFPIITADDELMFGQWVMKDFVDAAIRLKNEGIIDSYNEEQLDYAFDYCLNSFDASVGINWDMIDQSIIDAVKQQ